jgi:choline-glycine betaine transporter
MGDAIDAYSIVMTVAGVCTSLGLGTIQIVGTFRY